MLEIRNAVCAVLVADAQLVSILGAPSISGAWPAVSVAYADVPTGVAGFTALPPASIDKPRGRIVVIDIASTENIDIRMHDDDLQVSIFSMSERLAAAVAWRIRTALHEKPLSLPAGIEFREMYCTFASDIFDDATRVFHQPMNLHVRWIG